jgi:octanoyl-[GcvH]:protein N-octanoyltransferase
MPAALRRLGVDARIGEVPGEYCPGEYSVNARGERKLMGVGQRVIRGAAHVGGVIVVRDSDRVRDVLEPVYGAMDVAWNPATTGSVEDELGAATLDDVTAALLAELRSRFDVETGDAVPATTAVATAAPIESRFRIGPSIASRRDAGRAYHREG